MGRATNDLISYYRQLAGTMRRLSEAAISEIESEEGKSIGEDLAKDFAPIIGKTGVDFEREMLLVFYNGLHEQPHLVGVMLGLETDPSPRKFLETTEAELEARYAKVGGLLDRRCFTH